MSNQISPFAQASFKKFNEYVKRKGGRMICGVVDENGRIWTNGDNSLAEKLVTKVNESEQQSWVPAGPLPCLPRHLSEMQNYHHFGEIKRTASLFINHFKKHGQKLGEVPNFKNK